MDAWQICEEFQPKVCAYVRGRLHDPHDVADLVSAVFMKVVQKQDSCVSAKADQPYIILQKIPLRQNYSASAGFVISVNYHNTIPSMSAPSR